MPRHNTQCQAMPRYGQPKPLHAAPHQTISQHTPPHLTTSTHTTSQQHLTTPHTTRHDTTRRDGGIELPIPFFLLPLLLPCSSSSGSSSSSSPPPPPPPPPPPSSRFSLLLVFLSSRPQVSPARLFAASLFSFCFVIRRLASNYSSDRCDVISVEHAILPG